MRGPLTGAGLGLILSAPLAALFFLAAKLLSIRFPPFVGFERLSRWLPGAWVTWGIDFMVGVLRRFRVEDTSRAAKVAEQALALALFVFACAVLGAVLFAGAAHVRRRGWKLAWGAVVGVGLSLPWLDERRLAASIGLVPSGFIGMALLLVWLKEQWRKASQAVQATRLDRRRLLIQVGGSSAVLTLAGVVLGRLATSREGIGGAGVPWSAMHPLPNADDPVQPVPGTRAELTAVERHYRVDINLSPPQINEVSWRLKVDGLVKQHRQFSLPELRAYEPTHQFVTLSCISNPVAGDLIGTTRWTGVRLSRLLQDVELLPDATHLKMHAADRYDEVIDLERVRADPRIMLAYAWDGLPLSPEHGYPLRIYIPDVYGMKQPKWIVRIEAISRAEPGYWVRRGWDPKAQVQTTAVIDVIGPTAVRARTGEWVLPVGGIAHSGARGISRVEVQVDDGPWDLARLRRPLSQTTWVIWRYEWPFREGRHSFAVRAFDRGGAPQEVTPAPPHPSGATGIHRRSWPA